MISPVLLPHRNQYKNYKILLFPTENAPDGTVCPWLFPTENGDNSRGCADLAGITSSHNRVVSGIEKMMSYLNKRRAKGE